MNINSQKKVEVHPSNSSVYKSPLKGHWDSIEPRPKKKKGLSDERMKNNVLNNSTSSQLNICVDISEKDCSALQGDACEQLNLASELAAEITPQPAPSCSTSSFAEGARKRIMESRLDKTLPMKRSGSKKKMKLQQNSLNRDVVIDLTCDLDAERLPRGTGVASTLSEDASRFMNPVDHGSGQRVEQAHASNNVSMPCIDEEPRRTTKRKRDSKANASPSIPSIWMNNFNPSTEKNADDSVNLESLMGTNPTKPSTICSTSMIFSDSPKNSASSPLKSDSPKNKVPPQKSIFQPRVLSQIDTRHKSPRPKKACAETCARKKKVSSRSSQSKDQTAVKTRDFIPLNSNPKPANPKHEWQPIASAQQSTSQKYGNNYSNPPQQALSGLRPIMIDGSNVAMGHRRSGGYFSSNGLKICIDFFLERNHKVYAFVPLYRRSDSRTIDSWILDDLENAKHLIFTPSRYVKGCRITPYDDRFIVQAAAELGGVIVSQDNYRDLLEETPAFEDVISNRWLSFSWVDDIIMFPSDPLGRRGPTLDRFLRF